MAALAIDPQLHWSDHYVRYGFAVLPGLVDRTYCAAALDEVRAFVDNGLPPDQWTMDNVPLSILHTVAAPESIFGQVYEQPRLRAALDEMFGSPTALNAERKLKVFIKPYDARAERVISPRGHIDFVNCPIPVFGSGFMFQVSLVDKAPCGGNISIYPGTHVHVQRCVMQNSSWRFPANWDDIPTVTPFEFVPQAGDVLFFHHLVGHEGNPCCTRQPRISLHCQALRDEWLTTVDPAQPGLSPWARSLALNGPFQTSGEKERMLAHYAQRRQEAG